jgi:hypothetical protein
MAPSLGGGHQAHIESRSLRDQCFELLSGRLEAAPEVLASGLQGQFDLVFH